MINDARLRRLPLFLGMTDEEVDGILTGYDLCNIHVGSGKVLFSQGQESDGIYFLAAGEIKITRESIIPEYVVTEVLKAPYMIPLHTLFGRHNFFSFTMETCVPSVFLHIPKADALRIATSNRIFLLHLLNNISTVAQKSRLSLLAPKREDVRGKILSFVREACMEPMGQKVFHIKMRQLAAIIEETRDNVSECLHALHHDGVITLRRGSFAIDL